MIQSTPGVRPGGVFFCRRISRQPRPVRRRAPPSGGPRRRRRRSPGPGPVGSEERGGEGGKIAIRGDRQPREPTRLQTRLREEIPAELDPKARVEGAGLPDHRASLVSVGHDQHPCGRQIERDGRRGGDRQRGTEGREGRRIHLGSGGHSQHRRVPDVPDLLERGGLREIGRAHV